MSEPVAPPPAAAAPNAWPPTPYEWAGGMPVLERLTEEFYRRVAEDPLLAPVFAGMDARHPQHVARFLAEVLGGPTEYSTTRGGHAHMVARHLGRHLTQAQRTRWIALLLATADDIALPDDPEFRSAFVAYLEWGSRLAVLNSQDGVPAPTPQPMPRWGWGEVGGPYRG
ncbi:MAG: group II truncated hemoglobin [Gemmatirosa sp.]|nr:group II truncated hemoglobin [Gemmatirosa sp.]